MSPVAAARTKTFLQKATIKEQVALLLLLFLLLLLLYIQDWSADGTASGPLDRQDGREACDVSWHLAKGNTRTSKLAFRHSDDNISTVVPHN